MSSTLWLSVSVRGSHSVGPRFNPGPRHFPFHLFVRLAELIMWHYNPARVIMILFPYLRINSKYNNGLCTLLSRSSSLFTFLHLKCFPILCLLAPREERVRLRHHLSTRSRNGFLTAVLYLLVA